MDKIIIAANKGFIVSEEGVLYNKKGVTVGSVLQGYHRCTIKVSGKNEYFHTHRLQAFQKYGYKLFDEGILVRHSNGNSEDNSWENILIGSSSDNMFDIPKNIRIKKALHATSFMRKFDKDSVKEFHAVDRSYKKTMQKFSITSKGTLNYILNN